MSDFQEWAARLKREFDQNAEGVVWFTVWTGSPETPEDEARQRRLTEEFWAQVKLQPRIDGGPLAGTAGGDDYIGFRIPPAGADVVLARLTALCDALDPGYWHTAQRHPGSGPPPRR